MQAEGHVNLFFSVAVELDFDLLWHYETRLLSADFAACTLFLDEEHCADRFLVFFSHLGRYSVRKHF